jgi:hypothetical protein
VKHVQLGIIQARVLPCVLSVRLEVMNPTKVPNRVHCALPERHPAFREPQRSLSVQHAALEHTVRRVPRYVVHVLQENFLLKAHQIAPLRVPLAKECYQIRLRHHQVRNSVAAAMLDIITMGPRSTAHLVRPTP